MRDATDRQLDYLDDLGYTGKDPDFMHVASMAIDMMKAGKSSSETEKAVVSANAKAEKSLVKPRRLFGCSCFFILAASAVFLVILAVLMSILAAVPR